MWLLEVLLFSLSLSLSLVSIVSREHSGIMFTSKRYAGLDLLLVVFGYPLLLLLFCWRRSILPVVL